MSRTPVRMNPFPGLRPFTQEEDYLFFGREEQTLELLQRLGSHRFVAVVGTSGSGKSSLVRCGLLSELLGGKMLGAGSSWEIAVTHPGGNPLALLTDALLDADLYDREEEHVRENLLATLSRSHFGLVEAVKQAGIGSETNFLLVVDQFEEIFRFQDAGQRQQEVANEFVSLLLEAVRQKDVPIYVVLTMRSDFIGECGQFEGLAEMVNRGEFLIPRLTREQYKRVIEGPIKVAGGQIAPRLLQRLLNDLGQQADQLPCLQHALMRTWDVWTARGDSEALDLDDYQRVGRMAEALSQHADEIYDSLASDRQRELCQGMFQALTVEESNSRGIRRPQRLGRLCQILEVPAAELIPIIDAYRHRGVTFLMPSPDVELTESTIIDISHESLMRVWTRLRQWVEEESQAAGIYHRLAESAALHEQNKAGLYRDPELGIALAWQEAKRPNAAWAERYRPGFDLAMAFLAKSQRASIAEEQALEAARQRELEQAQRLAEAERQRAHDQARAATRLRLLVRGLGVVAAVALLATVFAWRAREEARQNASVAESHRKQAEDAQQKTELALTEVAAARVLAEKNLETAVTAQENALQAEKRSREFRYATDVQLAATLLEDENANATRVLTRLSDHDPEVDAALREKDDLRGFEWHYLKRLVESRSTIFQGFDKPVVGVAVTPEGELLTLDSEASLQCRDLETRRETRPTVDLKKGRNLISSVMSRDGRLVALGLEDRVILCSTQTGAETGVTIPAKCRAGLMFSSDGQKIITVDSSIGWWDATTGKPIAVEDFKHRIFGASYHPTSLSADGLTVAMGGLGQFRSQFSVYRLNIETREITKLPDTGSNSGTKRTLMLSPDGGTIAVSYFFAGTIYFHDTVTGKKLSEISTAHPASVSAIAFSPDGSQLATAAMDGSIKVWKDFRNSDSTTSLSLMGHSAQVSSLQWTPDGKQIVSAGSDNSVRLWNLEQSGQSLHSTIAESRGVRVRYSPDGTLMAIAGDGAGIRLREGTSGEIVAELPGENDELRSDSVAFSPDQRLLAAGFGGKQNFSQIELWDIDRRERLAVLPGSTEIPGYATTEYSGIPSALAFSPDGKYLVTGFGPLNLLGGGDQGNQPLLVYDVASRRSIRRLEGHRNSCLSVVFSADGSRLASASNDGTVRIWDVSSWQELHVLQNPDISTDRGQRRLTDIAFSPDGQLLAAASGEGSVIIWDPRSGEHRQSLQGHSNDVWAVAFSPDGRTLASSSTDNTICLWNVATWRELVRLAPAVAIDCRSLVFSPNGKELIAANLDGDALKWTVEKVQKGSGPTAVQVAHWIESGLDLRSRIRLHSESPELVEALEVVAQQQPENVKVQAALAATRANRHATRHEWKLAVEQFDQLKAIHPVETSAWLRAPGLLRLVSALLKEGRPADAVALLAGGENRRLEDGYGVVSVSEGFSYKSGRFPVTLAMVYPESPVWKAGLRTGDQVLKFDDIELTAATHSDFLQRLTNVDTKLVLTVQHSRQDSTEAVEILKPARIRNDSTVAQIEELVAAVTRQLEESPGPAPLLELRAELAGLTGETTKQIDDYSAAIAALESLDPQPMPDLQRLYRRRGDAYVSLSQWSSAVEDYARGITPETTDDALRTRHARAQAEVFIGSWQIAPTAEWHPVQWHYTTEAPDKDWLRPEFNDDAWQHGEGPFGTQTFAPARTPWETKDIWLRRNFDLPTVSTEGRLYLRILCDDAADVYLNGVLLYHQDAHTSQKYVVIPLAPDRARLLVPGQNCLAIQCKNQLDVGYIDAGLWVNPANSSHSGLLTSLAPEVRNDPWKMLATACLLKDDQQAIDQLVERRPQSAEAIGDIFIQGAHSNWQRAIEIYSAGITSETDDFGLLSKRARAYERLNNWPAAAADWKRAVGGKPDRVKFLLEFIDRLNNANQSEILLTQRQHAQQILEATLQKDPADVSAIESLTRLLVISEQSVAWKPLQPVKLQSDRGRFFRQLPDLSITRGQRVISLPAIDPAVKSIRIETSSTSTPPSDGPDFSEYRIVPVTTEADGVTGRYVRLDLPGNNPDFPGRENQSLEKVLNLAEMQVFRGSENIALGRPASQSSEYDGSGRLPAERAVDGNTTGNDTTNSYAHTAMNQTEAWWEVDLGMEQPIDRLVVWNRVENGGQVEARMNHFRVRVLDAARNVVYEEVIDKAPSPAREIPLDAVSLAEFQPGNADEKRVAQILIHISAGGAPLNRLRISTTTEQRSLTDDLVKSESAEWTVIEPATVSLTASGTFIAEEDGSLRLAAAEEGWASESDLLPLAIPSESVQAVRIETGSPTLLSESAGEVFREYRVEPIGSARWNDSRILGQYVRLDLPGENLNFPREPRDGIKKMLNVTEVQVFQGDTNLAQKKPARQSSIHASDEASRAVDGDTNSLAHTHPEMDGNNPWWEVDLGSAQELDRIVVWARNDDWGRNRTKHFRVRVLDALRNVIFEQVIDESPQPSKEISLRSSFVIDPLTGSAASRQFSLRLDRNAGVNPDLRFRLSAAESPVSLGLEDLFAETQRMTVPAAGLATAYELAKQLAPATAWFGRALDHAKSSSSRDAVFAALQRHGGALKELLKSRPRDTDLQLASARQSMDEGRRLLKKRQSEQALNHLQQASSLLHRLLAEHPEPEWIVLRPTVLSSKGGAQMTLRPDGSILVSGTHPDEDVYTVVARAELSGIAAIRIEALPDSSLPAKGPGRSAWGNFYLGGIRISAEDRRLVLSEALFSFSEHAEARSIIQGKQNHEQTSQKGWSIYPRAGEHHTAILRLASPLDKVQDLRFELYNARSGSKTENLGCFRLSVTRAPIDETTTRLLWKLSKRELAELDLAIGQALAQLNRNEEAATAIARALDQTDSDDARRKLIEELREYQAPLAILADQRPQDLSLQLAMAKSLAEKGKEALQANDRDDALPQLAQAQQIFARLAAEQPDSTWMVLQPTEMTSAEGADLALEHDGIIFVTGNNADRDVYTLSAPLPEGSLTSLRLEMIPDERLPGGGAGRADDTGEFLLGEIEAAIKTAGGEETPLKIEESAATLAREGDSAQPVAAAHDSNPESFWGIWPNFTEPATAFFQFASAERPIAPDSTLVIRLRCGDRTWPRRNLGRFRLSITNDKNAISVARIHQELKASGLADLETSLGKAHARLDRMEEAAAAFHHAFDLAGDRDARMKIVQEASANEGVLSRLAELRKNDGRFQDVLSRHLLQNGDRSEARLVMLKARTWYEEQLQKEPTNSRFAKDLADLLIDVHVAQWIVLKPHEMNTESGATMTLLADGSILVSGEPPNHDAYTLSAEARVPRIRAVKLEALTDESLPMRGPGRGARGNFAMTNWKVLGQPLSQTAPMVPLNVNAVTVDYLNPRYPVNPTHWNLEGHQGENRSAVFQVDSTLSDEQGLKLQFVLEFRNRPPHNDQSLGRFRLSVTSVAVAEGTTEKLSAAAEILSPWMRLGAAYAALGELDRALPAFVRTLEGSGSAEIKVGVAQQLAAFEDVFPHLLEQFPEDAMLRLGQARFLAAKYMAARQHQVAADFISGALASFPEDLPLLNLRADALVQLEDWQAAESDFAKILGLEKDEQKRSEAENRLAEAHLRIGRFQQGAERLLERMFLSLEDFYAFRNASISQLLAGNTAVAKTVANKSLEKFASALNADQAHWLVRLFISQPGWVTQENKQKLLEVVAKTTAEWATPLTAAIHYRSGDLQQAEWLMPHKLDDPQVVALSAMLLDATGKTEEARSVLNNRIESWVHAGGEKPLETQIPSQQVWQEWAVRMFAVREATRQLVGPEIRELDESIRREPLNTELLLKRAAMLMDVGLYLEAKHDLEQLVALNAKLPEVHTLLGRALAGLHEDDQALPYLNDAVAASPEDARVLAARGAVLFRKGETEAACADLERSLELYPTSTAARALAEALLSDAPSGSDWVMVTPSELKSQQGVTLTLLEEGSVLSGGNNPNRDDYKITIPVNGRNIQAIALDVLPHESVSEGSVGRGVGGLFVITKLEVSAMDAQGQSHPVPLSHASADFESNDQHGKWTAQSLIGESGGWKVEPHNRTPHRLIAKFAQPIAENSTSLTLVIKQEHFNTYHQRGLLLGRFRISISEDPVAFAREQVRLASSKLNNPWAKLCAVYAAIGEIDRASEYLLKAVESGGMLSLMELGLPMNPVLDALKVKDLQGYASMLSDLADMAVDSQRFDSARELLKQLETLEPNESEWKQRLDQLRPGVLAVWNFNHGSGFWTARNHCEIAANDGVLTVRRTGTDPYITTSLSLAPNTIGHENSGGNLLTFRYRAKEEFDFQLYWSSNSSDYSDERMVSVTVPPSGDNWKDLQIPFYVANSLSGLRLDPNVPENESVEFDFIILRSLESSQLVEHIFEPELRRLTEEISATPWSADRYRSRALFHSRIGRWSEAAADFAEVAKRTPDDRIIWFRVATCLLMAQDNEAYEKLCHSMRAAFPNPADGFVADSVCKTCLLRPGVFQVSDLPTQKLIETANDPVHAGLHHWLVGGCGLMSYRDGKYQEAIDWTKRHKDLQGMSGALALAVRAMAEHQLGRTGDAKASLNLAEALIPAPLRKLGNSDAVPILVSEWDVEHDWLAAEILRREAEHLISGETPLNAR
jgi:WD40 repeat protein/tetratricopeptide (TPR) repeat protein